MERLEQVFRRIMEAGLTLGALKCKLARRQVEFLGHVVSEEGLKPNPRLLESIRQIKPPSTVTEVRSFLGLVGYYRRFIRGFSDIAGPLNRLLEKERDFQWSKECQSSFMTLKGLLLKDPIVAYPDFNLPFKL